MTKTLIYMPLFQEIVDAISEVVDNHINLIDDNGIIIISTDPLRINNFHEAGLKVIKTGVPLTVKNDSQYLGTRQGINYPITVNNQVIAAIGITGFVDDIKQYGFLIVKITEILIKDKQISRLACNNEQLTRNFINASIYNETHYYQDLLTFFSISEIQKYACLIICINKDNVHLVNNTVNQLFKKINNTIHTYLYPNKYIAFINECQYQYFKSHLSDVCDQYAHLLSIGIGDLVLFRNMHHSYQYAKIALKHSIDNDATLSLFEQIYIDILINDLTLTSKLTFIDKCICNLSSYDKHLLFTYFNNNLSLKETSNELFIHKNTLQLKLNNIYELTKLNPRFFKDSLILYLAIYLEKY